MFSSTPLQRKNIAVVYQYRFPDSRGGGERRLFEIFKKSSYSFDWYVQYIDGTQDSQSNDNGIHYIPLLNRSFKHRSLRETLSWSVSMLKIPFRKYNIIHVGQMPFFHIFVLILKLKVYRLMNAKRPVIILDWWEYWGKYWNRFKFPLNVFGIAIEKFILRKSSHIVVISDKTKNDIENIATSANIRLIHNGINLDLIQSADAHNSADFIYFGRLERHKRVDRSIQVFSELVKFNPKYKLEIIGEGSDKKDLELLVDRLGLSQSVHFSGRVDSNLEMYSLIKGSKCMLFFGTQEGGGSIALFEANACGVPVAHSYSLNGIDPSLITNKNGFFYRAFDKLQIAKDLHFYIENYAEIGMRESCVSFVKDKDWGNISDEYEKYFSEIIGSKGNA